MDYNSQKPFTISVSAFEEEGDSYQELAAVSTCHRKLGSVSQNSGD